MGVHGGNRLGGNSLMETMVFGKKVAEQSREFELFHEDSRCHSNYNEKGNCEYHIRSS